MSRHVVDSLFFIETWLFVFGSNLATAQGLANRTAEKVKPSALDLMLLFQESVRIRQSLAKGKQLALREVLFSCVADYNKSVAGHRGHWQQPVSFR